MNDVVLDTAELDRITSGLGKSIDEVLSAFAFEIEGEAKTLAPVDTGALRASIYTLTKDGGTSPDERAGHDYEPLPAPSGNVIAVVGSGIEYALFQEIGTSKMAAHPYLFPAVEHKAQKLNSGEMWRKLFEHQ